MIQFHQHKLFFQWANGLSGENGAHPVQAVPTHSATHTRTSLDLRPSYLNPIFRTKEHPFSPLSRRPLSKCLVEGCSDRVVSLFTEESTYNRIPVVCCQTCSKCRSASISSRQRSSRTSIKDERRSWQGLETNDLPRHCSLEDL